MAKIAFIGLGNMGGPMAANLVKGAASGNGLRPVGGGPRRRRREGRQEGGVGRRSREGRRGRGHHAAGRQACARGLRERRAAQRCQGRAADRLLDHRRRQRPPCRRAGGQGRAGDGRCAGLGRRRRRDGGHAHLHGGRQRRRFRQGAADPREDGQEHRAHRPDRRGAGGQDLQQHDPRHHHDRRRRRLPAGQAPGAGRAEAVRHRVDVVRQLLGGEQLSAAARARADLAGQPRLPGGLHGGQHAEGPEACPAGGADARAPARRWARRPLSSSTCSSTRAAGPRISRASSRCSKESRR